LGGTCYRPVASDFKAKNAPNSIPPSHRWGSLQRSPDPLAGFKGPSSKGREIRGREGRVKKWWERREEKGRRGRGRERHSISCLRAPQT